MILVCISYVYKDVHTSVADIDLLLMAMAARREERSFPPGYPAPPMSVTHVRMKYRRELGLCLNATSGLTNDWKILADALGFKVEEIDEIERKGRYGSPTEILLTDVSYEKQEMAFHISD